MTASFTVMFVELADLRGQRTVRVGNAFRLRNGAAAFAAVRISGEAFTAATASHVLKRNAVGIRRAAEADTHLGAAENAK